MLMSDDFKYEPDEILNLAIMSQTPYVIVEGVDDISTYEDIAASENIECEVYAIELIKGIAGGNNGIKHFFDIISELEMQDENSIEHFVLGIIDRDARYYRGEMPNHPGILCLDYYSIESHFVSANAINPLIHQTTRISSAVNLPLADILREIEIRLKDLYYFSLEALKGAIDPNYQAIVNFSDSPGRRRDANTIAALQQKKDSLDDFAKGLSLNASLRNMKCFVKGKWLLAGFSEELHKEISSLVSKCKTKQIPQCKMCERDIELACLYKGNDGFSHKSIYSLLTKQTNIPEFDYIKSRISAVAETACA